MLTMNINPTMAALTNTGLPPSPRKCVIYIFYTASHLGNRNDSDEQFQGYLTVRAIWKSAKAF
jgi:hypothetical protein